MADAVISFLAICCALSFSLSAADRRMGHRSSRLKVLAIASALSIVFSAIALSASAEGTATNIGVGAAILAIVAAPIWLHALVPFRCLRESRFRRAFWSGLVIVVTALVSWYHLNWFVAWRAEGEASGELNGGGLNPFGMHFVLILAPQITIATIGVLFGVFRILYEVSETDE